VSHQSFRASYQSAFLAFVDDRSEQALRSAYELGRDAVKSGLSALEVVQVHHEVLDRAVLARAGSDVSGTIAAAADFLVESLAAFEMVQRGFSAARRAAFVERRNARLLRHLSSVLADESLATGDRAAFEEVLQLVAEHAREVTDAHRGAVYVAGGAQGSSGIDVRSETEGDDTWSEVLQPREPPREAVERPQAIRAPLRTLDGAELGWVEVADKNSGEFTDSDRAVLNQVAQMTAAAIERGLAYP
jgi:Phosphoserine phosphatase RsbU, N-terminal domain